MPNDPSVVTYAIDAQDNIIGVDDAWTQFADSNAAGRSLRPESVTGKSLWHFIRQPALRQLYEVLIEAARHRTEAVQFRYRCDSPDFRRYMEMRMEGRVDGGVTFVSRTLHTEKQKDDLRSAAAFVGQRQIVRCSVCNRYRSGNLWCEASELVTEKGVMNHDQPTRMVWSVCQACRDSLTQAAR